MTTLHGTCDSAFEAVRAEFARGFEEFADDPARGEIGAAVAVTIAGRPVVDLWAGHADPEWKRLIWDKYDTKPKVTYYEVPVVVDNVMGELYRGSEYLEAIG